jgi:hypothetical protein
MRKLLLLSLVVCACRTEIRPRVRDEGKQGDQLVDAKCLVHFYASALDIPNDSKGLGWLTVAREGTEDETFEKLRQTICSKGGNAFSQAHWLREDNVSVADPPTALEANAWYVPNPTQHEP